MAEYIIIRDHLPLVLIFSPSRSNVQEIDRYIAGMDAIYDLKQPVAWLTYLPQIIINDGTPQKRIGAWMKTRQKDIREFSTAVAFYTESKLFSFILSSLFLFQTIESPYKVSSKLSESLDFLDATCRQKALQLPLTWREKVTAQIDKPRAQP